MALWYFESKSGRPYVLHEIQKLPAEDQERLTARIDLLAITGYEPDDKDMKQLKQYDNLYQLKVRCKNNSYRIFFTITKQDIHLIHMADKKADLIRKEYETAQARIFALRKDKKV